MILPLVSHSISTSAVGNRQLLRSKSVEDKRVLHLAEHRDTTTRSEQEPGQLTISTTLWR